MHRAQQGKPWLRAPRPGRCPREQPEPRPAAGRDTLIRAGRCRVAQSRGQHSQAAAPSLVCSMTSVARSSRRTRHGFSPRLGVFDDRSIRVSRDHSSSERSAQRMWPFARSPLMAASSSARPRRHTIDRFRRRASQQSWAISRSGPRNQASTGTSKPFFGRSDTSAPSWRLTTRGEPTCPAPGELERRRHSRGQLDEPIIEQGKRTSRPTAMLAGPPCQDVVDHQRLHVYVQQTVQQERASREQITARVTGVSSGLLPDFWTKQQMRQGAARAKRFRGER